jgi:hypothetical protein
MGLTNHDQVVHSADVRMHLHVNGHTLDIRQLGPDFIILGEPVNHPPARAEITVSIDGRVSRWPVRLPDGLTADRPETRICRFSSEAGTSAG